MHKKLLGRLDTDAKGRLWEGTNNGKGFVRWDNVDSQWMTMTIQGTEGNETRSFKRANSEITVDMHVHTNYSVLYWIIIVHVRFSMSRNMFS
jgi:hypothetical protein